MSRLLPKRSSAPNYQICRQLYLSRSCEVSFIPPPAPHLSASPKSPTPNTRYNSFPRITLSLKEALNKFDDAAVKEIFSSISSKTNHVTSTLVAPNHILHDSSLRFFKHIIKEGKEDPLAFIKMASAFGSVNEHYDILLQSALSKEHVSKLLPIFEAAYKTKVYINDELSESELHEVFRRQGNLLYLAYLYLKDKQVESNIIAEIDLHWRFIALPQIVRLEKLRQKFSKYLFEHLYKLAVDMESRYFFSSPSRLQATLKELVDKSDSAGIQELYNQARKIEPSPLDDKSYALFISSFLAITRSQQKAFKIWEEMIQSDIIPGVSCWTVLLNHRAPRNPVRVLDVWAKMIESGVIPDNHCWTARINSQLLAGQVNDGMQSFRQMIDSGLTPTVVTINAVITGLLRLGRLDLAFQIMALADEINVKPDIVTYNTLIKQLAESATSPNMMSILENMQSQGIIPDVFTYTILLGCIFKQSPQTANQKRDEALAIIAYMEKLEIKANVNTYTTIIGGLLGESNFEAVEGVRQIMAEKGIKETAATYTVLIKDAFERHDSQTVQRLWEQLLQKNIKRDNTIWHVIIRGYAQLGEVFLMQQAMENMRHEPERMVIQLKTYAGIISALDGRGQSIAARKIVEHVIATWGEHSETTKYNDSPVIDMFWHVVKKLGGTGWMEDLRTQIAERQ